MSENDTNNQVVGAYIRSGIALVLLLVFLFSLIADIAQAINHPKWGVSVSGALQDKWPDLTVTTVLIALCIYFAVDGLQTIGKLQKK